MVRSTPSFIPSRTNERPLNMEEFHSEIGNGVVNFTALQAVSSSTVSLKMHKISIDIAHMYLQSSEVFSEICRWYLQKKILREFSPAINYKYFGELKYRGNVHSLLYILAPRRFKHLFARFKNQFE